MMTGPHEAVSRLVILDPKDTVAVCVTDTREGEPVGVVQDERLVAITNIPRGHKIALRDHEAGAPVLKYGERIGVASVPIRRGEHVHVHNLMSARARRDAVTGGPVP
jgi:altronate dehydratase